MTFKPASRDPVNLSITVGLLDVPTMDVSSTDVARCLQDRINVAIRGLYAAHPFGPLRLPPPRSYKVALLSMGAVLRANGFHVRYANTDYMEEQDIRAHLDDCDVVLVSDTTPQLGQIRRLLRSLREAKPGVFVITGGHHSTLRPHDLLADGLADIAVAGDGESFLAKATDALRSRTFARLRGLPGVAYMDSAGAVRRAPQANGCVNSDALPLPAYDLLPGGLGNFHAYLMTLRGCGIGCPFCSSDAVLPAQRRVSALRFAADLGYVAGAIGDAYNVLHIADDRPPLAPRYWEEVRGVRSGRRDPLHFICELRLAQCTPTVLSMLQAGGVVQVNVGIESLSDPVLARIRPNQSLVSVRNALAAIRDCFGPRIIIKGYFMVGLPGETCHTVADTIQEVVSLMAAGLLDFPSVRMFKPLPGSKIHSSPDVFGITLTGADWTQYERYSFPAIHRTEAMSEHQLYAAYLLFQSSVAACLERRAGIACTSTIQSHSVPYRTQLSRLV